MTSVALSRVEQIESKIDGAKAGQMLVGSNVGGIEFHNMAEVLEFAKLMAVSMEAVPAHCRAKPGVCLGVIIQSVEWRMSPYAVANKSYVVNDRLAYESQLIHAVIEQRAPIIGRLRHAFIGEGASRRCKVWATAKGEAEPLEYTSPEIGTIRVKNSPLWKDKPDLQLYYNASRDWARMYFPDVILGVYADDEIQAIDVKPAQVAGRPQINNLEDLTGHIEKSNGIASEADSSGSEIIEVEPEPVTDESTIAAVNVLLAATKTAADVTTIKDLYVGKDSPDDVPYSQDVQNTVAALCLARLDEIKKPTKQKELA